MTRYNDEEAAQELYRKRHWHLEKSVSVSHLLSTLALVMSALVFASKMDTRISLLEERKVEQTATDIRQDAEHLRNLLEYRASLTQINEKLDRLIERELRRAK